MLSQCNLILWILSDMSENSAVAKGRQIVALNPTIAFLVLWHGFGSCISTIFNEIFTAIKIV